MENQGLFEIKRKFLNKNRKVKNQNVILTYKYDKNGEICFEVAEILDAEAGLYMVLNSQQIILGQPFAGKSDVKKIYKYYNEFGGGSEEVEGVADYNELDRDDNVVYSPVGIMYSSKQELCFSVVENFHRITDNKNFYVSSNLHFERYGNDKKPFIFKIFDKNGLLKLKTSTVEKWIEFEEYINQVYRHYLHTGKNFHKDDEWRVKKEMDIYEQKQRESHKRIEKAFGLEIISSEELRY